MGVRAYASAEELIKNISADDYGRSEKLLSETAAMLSIFVRAILQFTPDGDDGNRAFYASAHFAVIECGSLCLISLLSALTVPLSI